MLTRFCISTLLFVFAFWSFSEASGLGFIDPEVSVEGRNFIVKYLCTFNNSAYKDIYNAQGKVVKEEVKITHAPLPDYLISQTSPQDSKEKKYFSKKVNGQKYFIVTKVDAPPSHSYQMSSYMIPKIKVIVKDGWGMEDSIPLKGIKGDDVVHDMVKHPSGFLITYFKETSDSLICSLYNERFALLKRKAVIKYHNNKHISKLKLYKQFYFFSWIDDDGILKLTGILKDISRLRVLHIKEITGFATPSFDFLNDNVLFAYNKTGFNKRDMIKTIFFKEISSYFY